MNGALPLLVREVAPAKNLVSPAEERPVNLLSVALLIVFEPIFQSAILPVDAVNCPSINAPLAIKTPDEDTAKFWPNLTKKGLSVEGVKSI